MRLLLTGATGLIGRQLLMLLERGPAELHILARRPRPGELAGHISWHVCDLLQATDLPTLLKQIRPTHLLQCAWCMEPGRVWLDPDNLDWVAASLRLLRAFGEAGGSRLVMVGTCAEYDWSVGVCREADTRLQPKTLYGVAKNATHQLVEAYCRGQLSHAWVRLFNTYGPFEDQRRLVAGAVNALLSGQEFRCTDGTQLRDFLHVYDVAEALLTILQSDFTGAVNVGSGQPVTIGNLLRLAAEQVGRPDLLRLGALPRARDDPDILVPDVAQLVRRIRWTPRYTLAEGLSQTISWWRKMSSLPAVRV
jgi:nucleoside-diphosphate-sugar epimerase